MRRMLFCMRLPTLLAGLAETGQKPFRAALAALYRGCSECQGSGPPRRI